MLTFVVSTFIFVLLWIWIERNLFRKTTLPGPYGLPIVGYIPFMTRKPHVKFAELAKTYGSIYEIKLGSRAVVVINDFELLRDAFSEDAFVGRPPDLPTENSDVTNKLDAMNGLPFKDQRRFTLHMLKDLGLGKTRMEEFIQEEIQDLLYHIKDQGQKQVPISALLTTSTSNVISSLILGRRMLRGDPQRIKLDRIINEVGRLIGDGSRLMFLPWLAALLNLLGLGCKSKLKRAVDESRTFMRAEMENHESTLDPHFVRDFIDGYLLEIEKRRDDPGTSFHKEVLLDLARTFLGAGSDTVRVFVEWFLLLMADQPAVQRRIQLEADEVLGRERFPVWQDRLRMPFTEATICEVLRWANIVPLNILRYTLYDVRVGGHLIPRQTRVLGNLYAVSRDERLWGPDADSFRPQRFLTSDGTKVLKPDSFIPFSIGKRQCPGKILGEIEIFLYVVAILQMFQVSMPPGRQPSFETHLGLVMQPVKQDLCFTIRQ